MTTTLRLRPRPAPATLIAWQFHGQPFHEWPSWVQKTCVLQRGPDGKLELRHDRRSGAQIVFLGEWLVRDLDGGICWFTDSEIEAKFEQIKPPSSRS